VVAGSATKGVSGGIAIAMAILGALVVEVPGASADMTASSLPAVSYVTVPPGTTPNSNIQRKFHPHLLNVHWSGATSKGQTCSPTNASFTLTNKTRKAQAVYIDLSSTGKTPTKHKKRDKDKLIVRIQSREVLGFCIWGSGKSKG
jgi:hypothetical protein